MRKKYGGKLEKETWGEIEDRYIWGNWRKKYGEKLEKEIWGKFEKEMWGALEEEKCRELTCESGSNYANSLEGPIP